MMLRRMMLLGSLAAAMFLTGGEARAGYSFTTGTVTANPLLIGGTVSDTFTTLNSSIATDQAANYNFVTINYSNLTTTPVSGSQTLSWVETLVSTTTGATGTFSIIGTLSVFGATNGGVPAATFSPVSVTPIGGAGGFSVSFTGYDAVTFNTSAGTASSHLAFNVSPPTTAPAGVPEPASVALLGSGLLGILGVGVRCRKRAYTQAVVGGSSTA
jgi:hypothetical protein